MQFLQQYMNNLIDMNLPINSNYINIKCCIPPKSSKSKEDIKVLISLNLPFTCLIQKIEFQLNDEFCKEDFAKVFLLSQLLRKCDNSEYTTLLQANSNNQAKNNADKSGMKAFAVVAGFDSELEQLRDQVLNFSADDASEDTNKDQLNGQAGHEQNKHMYKVCGVASNVQIILKVSETFGCDLTSAKEMTNKELQEDLRSLSRMQEESEANCNDDDNQQDHLQATINSIKPQIGQLEIKNSQQDIALNNQNIQQEQSRNTKQQLYDKQEQSSTVTRIQTQKENDQQQEQQKQKLQQDQQTKVEVILNRAFQQIVQGVKICAWPCFRIPAANNLIPLMNCAFFLQQNSHFEEKRDIDFLSALSLMNGRKFIQACEQFRKLQVSLLQQGTQVSIDKAIQLEILIADSMNQHSQMFEKMQALQRAVDLSLRRKVKPLNLNTNTQQIHQIREEESYRMLMRMQPQLIKILLQNIDSKIEAIKLSVLRTIEFILDTIGCSLDQYLVHILISIISTYPRQQLLPQDKFNFQNQRPSFFEMIGQGSLTLSNGLYGQLSSIIEQKLDISQYFSLDNYIIDFNDKNLQIKDGQQIQQQYLQSIKNLQNHILETFISLLSSLTSNVLHSIYNEVIQKNVFLGSNPFENQLATDLRIYLLKFTDKVINICQGDIILSQGFLNNMVSTMIPDQRLLNQINFNQTFKGNGSGQIGKLGETSKNTKLKANNETVSLACQNLWQTFRQKLFVNYANKGLKSLLEWIFQNLVTLAEHSDNLTADDQSKLTLVVDVIELIANQQSSTQQNIMQLYTRNDKSSKINQNQTQGANLLHNSCLPMIYTLELYALINPLLFWLDYSLEKSDRLPLFRLIWRTFTRILSSLPDKKIDIDISSVILPVLMKVNSFCQNSSPSQEMLQFLIVVLTEFKDLKLNKDMQKFLGVFLKTISKCIPHQLHDEIFQVCELLLELILMPTQSNMIGNNFKNNASIEHQQQLTEEHIGLIVDALIDRYTMRSKAHKKLTSQFIQIVLDKSQKEVQVVINEHQIQQEQLHLQSRTSNNLNQENQLQIQTNNFLPQLTGQAVGGNIDINEGMDNFEYDQESYQYLGEDDDEYDGVGDQRSRQQLGQDGGQASSLLLNEYMNSTQNRMSGVHIGGENQSNQDYSESPVSQRVVHHQMQQQHHQMNQGSNLMLEHTLRRDQLQDLSSLGQLRIGGAETNAQIINSSNQQQIQLPQEVQTTFDMFIEYTLFKNVSEATQLINLNEKQKIGFGNDQILQELYFEKIGLVLQMIRAMTSDHIQLFQKLMSKDNLKICCNKIFMNDRSSFHCFEILECLSSYYMTNCAPKNVYEHPTALLHNQLPGQGGIFQHHNNQNNNNNQNSQSSGHQNQFSHNNMASSRNSFISNNNNNQILSRGIRQNIIGVVIPNQAIRGNGMTSNLLHQQDPNQDIIDDDLLAGINIQEDIVKDELDIINKERLILIQIFAGIIRMSIEYLSKQPDSYLQFNTLNLIDNLFSNLMPVPTFQNILVKKALQKRGRGAGGGNMNHHEMNREMGDQQQQQNNSEESKIHQFEIPDLEKMTIIQEFECTDAKYLHARLQFAIKIWNFLEQSFFTSSWSNIRSTSYGVMCQAIKIEIQEYKKSYQAKLKKVLFPLMSNLINSKESESKAGGLNVLGSFCGLGYDFSQVNQFKISDNLSHFRKNSAFVSLAIWQQVFNIQDDWDSTIREAASVLVQVCAPRESIKHFQKIAKEKYQLKLTSLINTFNAAANHSLRHKQYLTSQKADDQIQSNSNALFDENRIQEEEFKFNTISANNLDSRNMLMGGGTKDDTNFLLGNNSQRVSLFGQTSANGAQGLISSQNDFQNISGDEEEDKSNSFNNNSEEDEGDNGYFYVDQYNEEQIKEIVEMFKNDYKPPKNLWIEKNGYSNNLLCQVESSNNNNQDLIGGGLGIDQFSNQLDVFEDNIVNKLNFKLASQNNHSDNLGGLGSDLYFNNSEISSDIRLGNNNGGGIMGNKDDQSLGESDYLIFERHFEEKKLIGLSGNVGNNNDSQKNQSKLLQGQLGSIDGINQEDLGIIDLDNDDVSDEFDELDDDKLPVLKNTYSKKTRPNNSKSMAIGSRSQGGKMKQRSAGRNNSEEEEFIQINQVKKQNAINSKQQVNQEEEKIQAQANIESNQSKQIKGIPNEDEFSQNVPLQVTPTESDLMDNYLEYNSPDMNIQNQEMISHQVDELQAQKSIEEYEQNLQQPQIIQSNNYHNKTQKVQSQNQKQIHSNQLQSPIQQDNKDYLKNDNEQDKIIDQYEQLIAASITNMNLQFQNELNEYKGMNYSSTQQISSHSLHLNDSGDKNNAVASLGATQMQSNKGMGNQITATMRLNKILEDQLIGNNNNNTNQQSQNKKNNKSLDKSDIINLSMTSNQSNSHLRQQQILSPQFQKSNNPNTSQQSINLMSPQSNNQMTQSVSSSMGGPQQHKYTSATISSSAQNNNKSLGGQQTSHSQIQQIKKINDPIYSQKQHSYSSQATSKSKGQGQRKEGHNNNQNNTNNGVSKTAFTYTTPGAFNSLQSTGQQNLSGLGTHSQSQHHTISGGGKQNSGQPQSTGQSGSAPSSGMGVNAFQLSYGAQQQNARKKKNDNQRKSEVPGSQPLHQLKKIIQKQNSNQMATVKQNNNHSQIEHTPLNNNNNNNLTEQSQDQNNSLSKSLEKYVQQNNNNQSKKTQQSLMSQAKQAFVSRAKSQSYLNNVMAIGSNSSLSSQSKSKKSSFKQPKPYKNSNSLLGGIPNNQGSYSGGNNSGIYNSAIQNSIPKKYPPVISSSGGGGGGNNNNSSLVSSNNKVEMKKGNNSGGGNNKHRMKKSSNIIIQSNSIDGREKITNSNSNSSYLIVQGLHNGILNTQPLSNKVTKGYFSNDESDNINLISPIRSSDIKKKSQSPFSSGDHQYRASSHNIKRKNKVITLSAEEQDDVESISDRQGAGFELPQQIRTNQLLAFKEMEKGVESIKITDIKVSNQQEQEYLKSRSKLEQYKQINSRTNSSQQQHSSHIQKSRYPQVLDYKKGGVQAIEVSCSQGDYEEDDLEAEYLEQQQLQYQQQLRDDQHLIDMENESNNQEDEFIEEQEDDYGNEQIDNLEGEGDIEGLECIEDNSEEFGKTALKPLSSIDEEEDISDQKQVVKLAHRYQNFGLQQQQTNNNNSNNNQLESI